jgi:hypothetical protein
VSKNNLRLGPLQPPLQPSPASRIGRLQAEGELFPDSAIATLRGLEPRSADASEAVLVCLWVAEGITSRSWAQPEVAVPPLWPWICCFTNPHQRLWRSTAAAPPPPPSSPRGGRRRARSAATMMGVFRWRKVVVGGPIRSPVIPSLPLPPIPLTAQGIVITTVTDPAPTITDQSTTADRLHPTHLSTTGPASGATAIDLPRVITSGG